MITLNKQNSLIGLLFIGLGVYYFLRHLNIPILAPFYSWPTLVIFIGIAFLLHSYWTKDHSSLFTGVILTGFGLHFIAVDHVPFWRDHWGMYLIILGVAFLLHYRKTKNGLIPALLFLGIGMFAMFAPTNPTWFQWIQGVFQLIERFWPLALVAFGFYLLKKK
ncbi:LiaI-LiaF-like domain-containing protein [Halobacillus litoralis]|uniref:LiaI-LiaF-like domain-containing protein n=1 Tax=Halobacillus litoralis TaxID=45668 RepID=UPI003005A875